MRKKLLLCSVLVSTCVAAFLSGGLARSQEEAIVKKADIKQLLVERRETCRQLVQAVMAQHEAGAKPFQDVIRARGELLNAELALATTNAERLQVRKQQLDALRMLEKNAETLAEVGAPGGSLTDCLAAKASRLTAEIELQQEMLRGN